MEMESNGPPYNLYEKGFNFLNKVEGNVQKAEAWSVSLKLLLKCYINDHIKLKCLCWTLARAAKITQE